MYMGKPEEHSQKQQFEEPFSRSVETARFGVWEWNIETGELVWSPDCLEMFGLPSDFEMTYARFLAAVHPDDRERIDEAVKVALETGSHYSTEMRALWPDGSIHWVASRGRAYYNKSGKPVRMSGAGFDITLLKQTEDALHRARAEAKAYAENLANVVDAIPAITFFSVDREGRTMTAGRQAREVFGLPENANVSLSDPRVRERFKFQWLEDGRVLAPEELPVQRAASTGKAIAGKKFEVRFPDARSLYLLGHAVPLLDASGQSRGAVGAFLDITEIQNKEVELGKAQAQAKAQADNLAAILDSVPAITLIADDAECKHVRSSRFGYEVAKLPTGVNVSASAPTEDRQAFTLLENGRELTSDEAPLQVAAKTGREVRDRELEMRMGDGRTLHLFGHAAPLFNETGAVRGAVGAFLDVTQLKKVERELERTRAEAKAQADNLSAVLDALPAAAFISYDRKCEKIICNKAAYELLRIPIGNNPSLTAPPNERPDFIPLENGREIPGEQLPLQVAAATGQAVRGKEIEIRFRDGSSIFEYGHSVPLFDEAGNVRGAVGTYLDVTDMKVMEQRLRAANERFQVALRNTPITVFNQDLDLRYKWIYNPAQGYSPIDFIGKRDNEVFERPEDAAKLEAIKSEVIRCGKIYQGEIEIFGLGRIRTYHVTIEPQRDPRNNTVGVTGAFFDLTESKREAAEREKLAKQRQLALDAVHMGWWHYDPINRMGHWDETFRDIFGMSTLSGPSGDILKLVHPDDLQMVRTKLGAALNPAEPKAYITEYRIIRPDGTVRWVEAYGAAEFEGAGETRRALSASGTVRDITDRKEIEEQLRFTNARFEAALRGTPMTVFNQDTDLRFTWVYNPVGLHDDTQIVGKTDADLLEPHDAEWSMKVKRDVLRTGKPYEGEFEVTMAGIRRYYHVNIDPQRDTTGEIVGLTCSSFDLTDLRTAQRQIEELSRQRQLALSAAKLGWWRHDVASGESRWDETFRGIFGLAALSGKPQIVIDRVHSEDREGARINFKAMTQSAHSKPYISEYRIVQPDGSVRWIEGHGAPEFEGTGDARRLVAVSGTVQDVTERKLAEAQLHQTQEAFAKLVQNAPYGVYVVDSQFRLALTDPGSRTEAFRNVEPLDGRDFGEIMRILWPEPLAAEIIAIFHHTLKTGEPYYSERFRNLRRDLGDVKAYEWETHRITLPDGQYGVVCYYFDSTEMRNIEDALLRQRQRSEFVAEGSDVGFWFCDLPFDKVIWDKRVKKHFWLTPDDTPVTMDIFYSLLHPDDREPTRRAIENSINNNQQYDVEYRTIAPDGRQKWVRANGRTFYDETGKPVRFDGITQDITARKQAEEKLRASEARYRTLFETMTDGFVLCELLRDKSGRATDIRWIECNSALERLTGLRREAVVGRCASEVFPDEYKWWVNKYEQVVRDKSVQRFEHGSESAGRVWQLTAFPHEGNKFAVLYDDITVRKQAEDALKTSEARYRDLASSLEQQVHARTQELEQRNEDLLRATEELKILSGRLLQVQDEERRRIARDLHDSSGQLLTALGLDLSNIAEHAKSEKIQAITPHLMAQVQDSQKLVDMLHRELRTTTYLLHPPLLDEAGLFSAISWYVQGMTQRSGMGIEFDFPKDFGRLSREMELLIFRLVQESTTNIHRHSGSKTANIQIQRLRETVAVKVEDHGKGISAEKLAAIEAGSSGLGIRAMRERLRQFGGDLRIESGHSGTTVFATVPLQQPEGAIENRVEPVPVVISK